LENCQNCAMPENVSTHPGVKVVLNVRPQGKYERERKQTVWCCSDECAIQALAVAHYGPSTHKWPITLAQFRAMNPLRGSLNAGKKTAREKARELVWTDTDKSRSEQPKPALQSV